jgi:hypothetical protein
MDTILSLLRDGIRDHKEQLCKLGEDITELGGDWRADGVIVGTPTRALF